MRWNHAPVTCDLSLVCVEAFRYTDLVYDSIVHATYEIHSLLGVGSGPLTGLVCASAFACCHWLLIVFVDLLG